MGLIFFLIVRDPPFLAFVGFLTCLLMSGTSVETIESASSLISVGRSAGSAADGAGGIGEGAGRTTRIVLVVGEGQVSQITK